MDNNEKNGIERRHIGRVDFPRHSVMVDCATGEKYIVETENVSPLGMGIVADKDIPMLVGRDVIVVADTMIMYADVVRQEMGDSGKSFLGVSACQFSEGVLKMLFERIAGVEL
ncbi:MAG: hypothetical protein K6G22_13060 [Lachnospiraceae bacterium]|nr:hypothetical protein [Lachnospiraceae bacterium]